MDEAGEADQLTLLDEGRIIAAGTPDELVRDVGGQVLEIEGDDLPALLESVRDRVAGSAQLVDSVLRLEGDNVPQLVPEIMQQHGQGIRRLQLSHPSLHDVFLHKTGKRFVVTASDESAGKKKRRRR